MSPTLQTKYDMISAIHAQVQEECGMDFEHHGRIVDYAVKSGFKSVDPETFTCTRAELVQFALAAEVEGRFIFARRAGMDLATTLETLRVK